MTFSVVKVIRTRSASERVSEKHVRHTNLIERRSYVLLIELRVVPRPWSGPHISQRINTMAVEQSEELTDLVGRVPDAQQIELVSVHGWLSRTEADKNHIVGRTRLHPGHWISLSRSQRARHSKASSTECPDKL